jgi:hypothetical protein
MLAQAALQIELHRGREVEVLEVQDDRALIGSGAHCDVRLAPDEAAVEQLVVEAIGDEVFAKTRSLEPVCLLNGAPFLEGRLSPASVLELGPVALRARRIARQDQAAKAKSSSKSATSPTIQALGLIAVALGLYRVLSPKPGAASALADQVPQPPIAAVSAQPCPLDQQRAAAAFARETWLEAESKRERAPFHPGDGVLGASLFMSAAACYTAAGDAAAAARARSAARQLSEQASDAIHLGHVRLERFLATEQWNDARQQAGLLAALLTDQRGDYRQWLDRVARECELRSNQVKP